MKVLGAIPKKNNLSFEEMSQLQKIYELISEKNLLKNYCFPKNRWELLLGSDSETKKKINGLSFKEESEENKNNCDELSAELKNKARI